MFFRLPVRSTQLKNAPIAVHHGVFHKQITLTGAVAFIVAGSIGAGILGIPYAISKVGIIPGIFYILTLGLLMMGLNLLIGELSIATGKPLQLVGFAREYLGVVGEWCMSAIVYATLCGGLIIYIIGEGISLAAIFGGSSFWWSISFFVCGSFFVIRGLRMIKQIEFFLLIGLLVVILSIVGLSANHISFDSFVHVNVSDLLLPYGVILFAFHKTTTIPEAYSLLKDKNRMFKKAIIFSDLIVISLYILFMIVVVGVTGRETTEIATIGLGKQVGHVVLILGNIFAIFAMATSFLVVGVSLKDSLCWDFKIKPAAAALYTLGIPLLIFVLGLRQFISALDIVGGVFISLELLLILLMYWRAKQMKHLEHGTFKLHHTVFLGVILFITFSIGVVYSVVKMF
ncbi:MAG: hypothetical protein HYV41_04610 [Candidatus Magasanikbacteria bacterium]|nr:hypothetical protein [Candidatus Magasanikbacteria bacterium]